MKKIKKQLNLTTDTVRNLSLGALAGVNGGHVSNSWGSACPGNCTDTCNRTCQASCQAC